MQRATLIFDPGKRHQAAAMNALSDGLAAHGIETGDNGDFVVTWGTRTLFDQPQLVLEAGYINGQSGNYVQDRLRFVSANWNGLHGRADPVPFDCPPNRWENLGIPLRDWRRSTLGYTLVCDQHPHDTTAPHRGWWKDVEQHFRKPIMYRQHPLIAPDLRPLSEVLRGAGSCVTWSSSAAIEAICAGVPTWAIDAGSIARPVCAHALNAEPVFCDRRQWAYNLAYRQWTHVELADGVAWDFLRFGL